ncbi:tetratricopeptide repeat protein [Pelodictyon luteolum]|uniref:TPR repeat n=1 Tax=Chlorobium luteolum (strain DSM 273 / BCRC 81028 / 2530) TaxID=319225 RepID=Q3B4W5_CHLL3|nr:tetratricopeptide repeat protein [Pelodictyon luteolum]ABB23616.1 TPR repeat [Pelodictyon luteolum DSM 273]
MSDSALNPSGPALYAEALRCMEQQENERARVLLDQLLLEDYRDPKVRYASAMAHIALAAYRKAGCELLRSIVLDRSFVPAWRHLGFVQLTLGKEEEALKTLRHALELDPAYAETWCVLGDVHLDLGEYDEARVAFDHALELEPDNPEPHRKLAMFHVSRGDMKSLRAEYELLKTLDADMAAQIGSLFFDEQ